jgi:TolA-binding protein
MKTNWGTGTDMKRRACGTAIVLLLLVLALPALAEQEYLYSPKAVTPGEQRTKDDVLVREVPVQQGDTLSGISRRFSGHGSYYPQILLFNDIKNPNLIYAGDTIKVPQPKDKNPEAAETPPAAPKEKATRKHVKRGKGKHAHAAKNAPSAAVLPAKRAAAKAPAQEKAPAVARPMELSISDLKKLENGHEKKQVAKKKAPAAVRLQPEGESHKTHKPAAEGQAVKARTVAPPTASANETTGQKLYARALKAYRQEDFQAALDLFDRYLAQYSGSPQAADASLYKADCYLKLAGQ